MKIHSLLMTAFVLVAGFTPALTAFSHQAVTDTSQTAVNVIGDSLSVIEDSNTLAESSSAMLTNIENIKDYRENGDRDRAIQEAGRLSGNFHKFTQSYNSLSKKIDSSSDVRIKMEMETISDAHEGMQSQVSSTVGSVRTNQSISDEEMAEFRSNFREVSQASSRINIRVVDEQSSNLRSLHSTLNNLGTNIVMMGVSFMFIAVPIAYYCSLIISRPIRQLSEEADKIKREDLDEVDVSRIETRARELNQLKEVIAQMVLTLKAEFGRESSEMNQLGLDIAKTLADDVPQATAESSVASACKKLDIDTMEIEEGDLDDIVGELRLSMGGLSVNDETFERIKRLG